MVRIKSKKTGLEQLVTADELAIMQANSGQHAFKVLDKDATPQEAKAPEAKKKDE